MLQANVTYTLKFYRINAKRARGMYYPPNLSGCQCDFQFKHVPVFKRLLVIGLQSRSIPGKLIYVELANTLNISTAKLCRNLQRTATTMLRSQKE